MKTKTTNPKDKGCFLSHLFVCWVSNLVKIGSKRQLTQDDLFRLSEEDRAETIIQDFEQVWEDEILNAQLKNRPPKLWKAMLKYINYKDYFRLVFLLLLETFTIYSKPILLWFFLKLLTKGTDFSKSGHSYHIGLTLAGIAMANFIQAFTEHHNYFIAKIVGMRHTIALTGLIYKKVLKESRYGLSKETSGHVFNLVSNDIQRLRRTVYDLQNVFSFVIVGPTAFTLLCTLVQWQAISGAIFIIICGFSQVIVSKGYAHYRTLQALATDERLAVVNEVIKGIRTVKMHAWEWCYLEVMRNLRRNETNLAKKKTYFQSVIGVVHQTLYSTSLGISIFTLLFLDIKLDPVNLFVLLNILQNLGSSTTNQIVGTLHAYDSFTAVNRIETFLLRKAKIPPKAIKESSYSCSGKNSIASIFSNQKKKYTALPIDEPIQECKASISVNEQDVPCMELNQLDSGWNYDNPILYGITLQIRSNMLMMVTGPVGCGKTTLLMTILREIPILSGQLSITGKIAYVSQMPWVFTGTVRENILFGLPFNRDRYQMVLEVCDLNHDIRSFPNGDLSMIGQRGVMLSGGQRARVALARAVYSDADIVLLDDPLSAVDAKVGEHLLNECICGKLVNKIRVLVTHQLQHLQRADKVIVLKEGRVVGQGSYDEIAENPYLYHMIAVNRQINDSFKKTTTPISVDGIAKNELYRDRGVDLAEEAEDSEYIPISFSLYWKYLTSGMGSWLVVCVLMFFLFAATIQYISFWWLKDMVLMPFDEQRSSFTLGVYGGILAGNIIIPFMKILLLLLVLLRSAAALYDKMTIAMIKSPLVFFDRNPVGRIINRFSKDIGVLDDELPIIFVFGLGTFVPFFVVTGFLGVINYWFLLVTMPALITFVLIYQYYLSPAQDLSRLEGMLCGPVYDHVSETIEGLEVIHTANMKEKSMLKLYRLQNAHTKAFYLTIGMKQATGLHIALLSALFATLVIIGSFMLGLDPATCGLVFVTCTTLIATASYGVQTMTSVATLMVSVERVKRYTELPSEPGYDKKGKPPSNWPEKGALSIKELALKYLEGGAYVLANINLKIKPGERVGIAGRTGAGKTSLVAALLRMPDPEGHVTIDGVDLATLNIQDARRSMAVISQNPILFSGSLQHSIDPFSHFTAEQIWDALNIVQMKQRVSKLQGGLQYKIGEGGSGFSAGETQLLCLARALLQKCKILILDEATANVDYKTDQLVQQVIREKFSNCTVLTIAHRLNTIMDYDRVVVIERGQVVEFDSPTVLAAKPDGIFAKLLNSQQSNGKS